MSNPSEHTPLPWWIRKHPHDESVGIVVAKPTEDHPYFRSTTTIDIIGDEDYPRKRADQEFIVRAVNSFDDMLAALKAIAEKSYERFDHSVVLMEIQDIAEKAISEAECK